MSNKIRVLDNTLANKIAAGEVIERPVSVIKELIENSIDALSSAVSIDIENGGLSLIRVADNGIGIDPGDVKTAFMRHATSKISSDEDLFNIATLGFRGEALASILAVSNIMLKTRTKDAEFGSELKAMGGTVDDFVPCGCPEGTIIEVRDLFYNVPARLKFMKSPRSEATIITDYISRMILSHPEISFRYSNSGRMLYRSSGDGSLESAIYTVYGNEMLPYLRPVDYANGYVAIKGFVGSEIASRPTRVAQSFIVNGRYIRSARLQTALSDAYGTRLMSGHFPFAVLNVDVGFSEVDVNVHPNKLEVRFKNEPIIVEALLTAVRRALGGYAAPLIEACEDVPKAQDETDEPAPNGNAEGASNSFEASDGIERNSEASSLKDENGKTYHNVDSVDMTPVNYVIASDEEVETFSNIKSDNDERMLEKVTEAEPDIEANGAAAQARPLEVDGLPVFYAKEEEKPVNKVIQMEFTDESYRFLCSVFDTYWMVQQGENVFIIDQHAAHERYFYEGLMGGKIEASSQMLLIPEVVTLTPREYEIYERNKNLFNEFGFVIEQFGPHSLRLTAVPSVLGKIQKADFIRSALALLADSDDVNIKDVTRNAIVSMSCKSAIKAGDAVPEKMIAEILHEYRNGRIPMTCPHGRPVMIAMTKNNIVKMFKRTS